MSAKFWKHKGDKPHEAAAQLRIVELLKKSKNFLGDADHVIFSCKIPWVRRLAKSRGSIKEDKSCGRDIDVAILRPGSIILLELKKVGGCVSGNENAPWTYMDKQSGSSVVVKASGGNPFQQVKITGNLFAGYLQEMYHLWSSSSDSKAVTDAHKEGLKTIHSIVVLDGPMSNEKDQVDIDRMSFPWFDCCRLDAKLRNALSRADHAFLGPQSPDSKLTAQIIEQFVLDLNPREAIFDDDRGVLRGERDAKEILSQKRHCKKPSPTPSPAFKASTQGANNQLAKYCPKASSVRQVVSTSQNQDPKSKPLGSQKAQEPAESKVTPNVVVHKAPSADKGSLPSVIQKRIMKQDMVRDESNRKPKTLKHNLAKPGQTPKKSDESFVRLKVRTGQKRMSEVRVRMLQAFASYINGTGMPSHVLSEEFLKVTGSPVTEFLNGCDLEILSGNPLGRKYFDFLYDDNGGFRIVPKQIHLDRRTITKKLVADVRRLTGDMLPEQMENHIERWACELKKDVNAFLVSCVLSLSE